MVGEFREHQEEASTQSQPEQSPDENFEVAEQESFKVLEKNLMGEIDKRSPRLETPKIETLESGGKQVAIIERKRAIENIEHPGQDLWLIVDFDDVLNHTTEENRDLHTAIAEETGIPAKKIEELYEGSKIETQDGKKVFRFLEFSKSLKTEGVGNEVIEQAIKKADHKKYIDEAVKRAVIASRFGVSIGYGDSRPAAVRVSILTHGDPAYQRKRIEASGVSEVADEVIYTEASKREVVEALAIRDYPAPKNRHGIETIAPFTITFDDSPEQIQDFSRLANPEYYVNVRFRHPQAKRFRSPHVGSDVVEAKEDTSNQAAFDLFTIALAGTTREALDRFRLSPFNLEKDRSEREKLLSSWGYDFSKDPTEEAELKYRGPKDAWVLKNFILGNFPSQHAETH